MIGISKLYCGTVETSDVLRYGGGGRRMPAHLLQFAPEKKPVVVWNVTQRCNLRCVHCYAQAGQSAAGELSTEEGRRLIDDLADFGVPVLLFSGGEPLLREDLVELIAHARERGVRAVLSSNGTLITPSMAARFKDLGLAYAGISLDGLEDTHDRFRGVNGAFRQALSGIRNCQQAGIKVGLRVTMHRGNLDDLPGLFDLLYEEQLPRLCCYHLVVAGRGAALSAEELTHTETRRAVDYILERTAELHRSGFPAEVLTVDNHCDGPYLYLRLLREDPARAEEVLRLLRLNGGNSSGIGIGCVSWDGQVYPDQFWRRHALGNVGERPFSRIWTDDSHPLLAGLRARHTHLHGRCAGCRWLDICNGNFRARAEAASGDPWAPDPACYLRDDEILP